MKPWLLTLFANFFAVLRLIPSTRGVHLKLALKVGVDARGCAAVDKRIAGGYKHGTALRAEQWGTYAVGLSVHGPFAHPIASKLLQRWQW